MSQAAKVFALNRAGLNPRRGAIVTGIFLVPLIVLTALGQDSYFLSMAFGAVFVAICDLGGALGYRVSRLLIVAGSGAVLTWLAFSVGQQSWPWVTLAAFAVTLVAGLFVKYGMHRFVSAYLLNIWFIIALGQPPKDLADHITINPWGQTLAWLIGGLVWIGCLTVVSLARSGTDQPAFIPEIPADISPSPLTPPKIAFALLRAVAVAAAISIAFGFQLPQAQ